MNGTTSFAHVVEAKPAPWRRVFRIIRWTSYAAVLIAMLMIMHAAPPPPVVTSSKAAARAEQKLQDVEQAVSAGQPATLRLDETELNSFLASHLDISESCDNSGSGSFRSYCFYAACGNSSSRFGTSALFGAGRESATD
jgi:hypothetical protein